jgi:hypothetical protein
LENSKKGQAMNNLAYTSQDPTKVGPKVEEILHKELTASTPLDFQVEQGGAGNTNAGSMMVDAARVLFGGKVTVLFTLHFELTQPRPFHLAAHALRQGVGCHIGALLYNTLLAKNIGTEVSLEDPKTFGTSKFVGDSAISAKLNEHGDLLKRAGKLGRTTSDIGGIDTKLPRFFKLFPQPTGGTMLVVNTLPRSTSMGMGAAMDAKEFCDLAALIESLL